MPFNHFDVFSGIYDRWGHFDRNHPLLEMLDLPQNGFILDIGGGTGRVAESLTGQGRQVVIIDISAGMLRRARGKPGILPVMSDSAALPFKKGTFLRVVMVDALHHIKDQSGTVNEMVRVLAKGGVGVVDEPDTRNGFVKLIMIFEFLMLMNSHFLVPEKLFGLFSGFEGESHQLTWHGSVLVSYHKLK